jgi:hypothetical protein
MKNYAWLGVIGMGALLAAACTVNNNNVTGNDSGEDSSTADGSGSSSGGSSGGDTGTPTPDTGTGDGGGGCTLAISTGSMTCDTCAQAHCCAEVNTCDQAGDGGVDDAGMSKCEQLATSPCVKDCVSPPPDSGVEAGSLMSCLSTCAGAGANPTDITNASNVLTCFATSCPTECSQ